MPGGPRAVVDLLEQIFELCACCCSGSDLLHRALTRNTSSSRTMLTSFTNGASSALVGSDSELITCTGNFSGGEYDQRHIVAFKKV